MYIYIYIISVVLRVFLLRLVHIFCGTEGSLLWFLEVSEHFLEYGGSRLA